MGTKLALLLADDCQAAWRAGDCDEVTRIACVEAEADLVEMVPQGAAARQQRSGIGSGMERGAAGGHEGARGECGARSARGQEGG